MGSILTVLVLIFLALVGLLLQGAKRMAASDDILAAIAQASTDLQALVAKNAGAIPPAGAAQILSAVQALDAAIVAATNA